MRFCEACGARYRGQPATCPLDGTTLRALPDPLLGQTIAGRYAVVEKIGAGGMGTVYRAVEVASGAEVALKFLLPELALDASHRARFLREAAAAKRIDHENIIDVREAGETPEGHVFLVMELLTGVSLADELRRGPFEVSRALSIAMQAASALARAHELGIIHRDIKPGNIHLLDGGFARPSFVKILDFGLAHMRDELRLTKSGALFGTPEYMAPEQARGAPVTGLADLYALGCVLFAMVAGAPPFQGQSAPDLILQHLRTPAPRLSSRVPGVPAALDALVERLLAKDPLARHHDGFHLLEELRKVAAARPDALAKTVDMTTSRASRGSRSDHTIPGPGAGVLPEGWEARAALLRTMVARAMRAGLGAPWLDGAAKGIEAGIAEARRIEAKLATAGEAIAEQDAAGRQLRLRLGAAIDALGADESRALREVERLGAELTAARERRRNEEGPLARQLSSLARLGSLVDRVTATSVRDAGELAARWIEADERVEALGRALADAQRAQDDLRFQLAQLKGRLAMLGVDHGHDTQRRRDEAAVLAREHEARVDEIHAHASMLLQYFSRQPGFEEVVRAASLPPGRAR